MVKTKKASAAPKKEQERTSLRLKNKNAVEKKAAPPKKAPKAKKVKKADNGSAKPEEPNAEVTETK